MAQVESFMVGRGNALKEKILTRLRFSQECSFLKARTASY